MSKRIPERSGKIHRASSTKEFWSLWVSTKPLLEQNNWTLESSPNARAQELNKRHPQRVPDPSAHEFQISSRTNARAIWSERKK